MSAAVQTEQIAHERAEIIVERARSTVGGGGADSCYCARAIAGMRSSTAAATARRRARMRTSAERPEYEHREDDRGQQQLHAGRQGKDDAAAAAIACAENSEVPRVCDYGARNPLRVALLRGRHQTKTR